MKIAISPYCRRHTASRYVASLVLLASLGACSGPGLGPEEQVRQWVSAAEAAAEAREGREMLQLISPAYRDARGYDRDDIGDMMRVYFLRKNSINLVTSIDDLRLYGDSAAEVDLSVGMAGGTDGVFGFSADAYNLQLELSLDGDEWLLISARWGGMGRELH